jgi:diguanylate cyclase (GGDEF)-like protein/PAS domain S-box-containing protein
VWDLNLRTSEANYSRRYHEMLGYGDGELEGTHESWTSQIHPDDQLRMQSVVANYLANPSAGYAAEYRLRCKDGSYKWIYARGTVVSRGADGKPLRMVGTHTDISALKAAEAKVWNEANFDPLTQLPNRRLFYDRLDMEIKQAKRDEELLALLFIDLDHFKEVNDTLGHHVGDQLLIEAARRIRLAVREGDTVARLGGDEFTVILAHQHVLTDVAAVTQKIIETLSQPYTLADNEAYVSASVGVAMYPSDALTVNDLVKNADQAMYAAKAAGRRGFQFFTQTMHDSAVARMSLVSDLRRALAASQFEVHYQPIVEFASGVILKAEALVRWRHPQRGLVSPADFIPLAEDIGVIHELGDWVFLQAAQQVAKWQALYGCSFQISVNKSPVQFAAEQRGHLQWVNQLKTMGLPGRSIVIEITEGVLMDSDTKVATSLLQFRDAGIQVAIDDFGTGYSSLSYLKKFDIDYLKIDKSFVQNLAPDSADFALCEAIIVMAHKLGLKVIAEGVETAQQSDMLKAMGCDLGQGYLFSRPIAAQAFEDLLSKA